MTQYNVILYMFISDQEVPPPQSFNSSFSDYDTPQDLQNGKYDPLTIKDHAMDQMNCSK